MGKQKFESTDICTWQDSKLVNNECGFAKLSIMHFWPAGLSVKTPFLCACWLPLGKNTAL